MSKYKCTICGFVYDEAIGYPEGNIAPGTKWEDVSEDWVCPLCGASKADFLKMETEANTKPVVGKPLVKDTEEDHDDMFEMSSIELSVLCSAMAKTTFKQSLTEESEAFKKLSDYFYNKSKKSDAKRIEDLIPLINKNLEKDYPKSFGIGEAYTDRGALRVTVWGEKVTRMLSSLLTRFEKQKDSMIENTNVFICESCGFIFVGDQPPEICPVCKVPKIKIHAIGREK